MDPNSVQHAMQDHDAVLSSIGSPANKIGTIRSTGTKNIIHAMEKAGIKRFICQASLGYAEIVYFTLKTQCDADDKLYHSCVDICHYSPYRGIILFLVLFCNLRISKVT